MEKNKIRTGNRSILYICIDIHVICELFLDCKLFLFGFMTFVIFLVGSEGYVILVPV